ncbi:MAG: cytochrome P450, partial [Myxococcaceae bacterium]
YPSFSVTGHYPNGRYWGAALSLAPPLISRLRPAKLRAGHPIAPGWLPALGHVPAMMMHLPSVLQGGAALGPFYWLNFGTTWILVCSKEESFQFFKNKDTASDVLGTEVGELLKSSLLELDGEVHRRIRSVMNGPFTPAQLTASGAGEIIARMVAPRVARWATQQTADVQAETRELAIDVIFAMIGIPVTDLPRWRIAFEDSLNVIFAIPFDFVGTPLRRARIAGAWVDSRLREIIHAVRSRPQEATLLSGLVHGRDEEGKLLGDEELAANLRILALAGHETTASTMCWTMLHLARRPELWDRLVGESLAADSPPMSPDALKQCPFAEHLFREALRLYPPVPLDMRRVIKPLSVLGQEIPVGTNVGVDIWQLSHDPARYPDPFTFRPERWEGAPKRPGQLETVQFGGGPHFCLGYHVALLEGVHFIVAVAREMGRRGLRPAPVSDEALPSPVWFPISKAPRGSKVRWVRSKVN